VSKADLSEVQDRLPELRAFLATRGVSEVHAISAVTGEGVDDLLLALERFDAARRASPEGPDPGTDPPPEDDF